MADFIAYYRVSTDRQRASGLRLDAQRQAVADYLSGGGDLLAEHTEIESGKRHTNRPQLLAALDECRRRRAVLLIARLDRLARNVALISALMESGADFVAVDMPQASKLPIHIMAAVAEHDRELISQRTKAALATAKKRGAKLGNPRLDEARARPGRAPGPQARAGSPRLNHELAGTGQELTRDRPRSQSHEHPHPRRRAVVRVQRPESPCCSCLLNH